MDLTRIETVTFDVGGTLAQGELDTEQYTKTLQAYFRSLGFAGGSAQLNRAKQGMLERIRHAQRQNRELRFEEAYQGLVFDLGLHPTPEIITYIQQVYYRFFRMELVPQVEDVLKTLSHRYKLAIISNIISNVSRYAFHKAGLDRFFEQIVLSRDLGIRKPDPDIFHFTLEALGVTSDRAIHVGNSLDQDVFGAHQVGMNTVWITPSTEATTIQPDFTISTLSELITIL